MLEFSFIRPALPAVPPGLSEFVVAVLAALAVPMTFREGVIRKKAPAGEADELVAVLGVVGLGELVEGDLGGARAEGVGVEGGVQARVAEGEEEDGAVVEVGGDGEEDVKGEGLDEGVPLEVLRGNHCGGRGLCVVKICRWEHSRGVWSRHLLWFEWMCVGVSHWLCESRDLFSTMSSINVWRRSCNWSDVFNCELQCDDRVSSLELWMKMEQEGLAIDCEPAPYLSNHH